VSRGQDYAAYYDARQTGSRIDLKSPGADHDVADLVALLDRSRRSPSE